MEKKLRAERLERDKDAESRKKVIILKSSEYNESE